jgi:signal peptidase I
MVDPSSYSGAETQTELQQNVPQTTGPHYREYVKTVVVTLLVALFLKTFVLEAFRIPSASMENTLLVGDFLIVNKLAYGVRTPRFLPLTNVAMPAFTVPLFSHVRQGDVVVFEFPGAPDELKPTETVDYVKRCIGLPGDTVHIRQGRVFVNGTPLTLPQRAKPISVVNGFRGSRRFRLYPPGSMFSEYDYGPLVVPSRGQVVPLDSSSIIPWKMLIQREGHRVNLDEAQRVLIDGRAVDRYVVQRDYYFMMGDNRGNSLDSRYWGFVPEDNIIGEALVVYWSWDPGVTVPSIGDKFNSIRWNRIGTLIR